MTLVTGVDGIAVSDVKQYNATVGLLLQGGMSKLRKTVFEQHVTGESVALMDQIGSVDPVQHTNRHADTPLNPVPRDRRWVVPQDWHMAEIVDKFDNLRQLADPMAMYPQAFAKGFGRRMDDIILEGIYGTNKTGNAGTDNSTFTSGNIVGDASAKLTIAKLMSLRVKMLNADLDPETDKIWGIISPEDAMSLIDETEVGSSDYNSVKPLVEGNVSRFMGINFIVSNRIAGAAKYNGSLSLGSNIHRSVYYSSRSVGLGIWKEFDTEITPRADKSNAPQIYSSSTLGATRLEEAAVFAIDSDHS